MALAVEAGVVQAGGGDDVDPARRLMAASLTTLRPASAGMASTTAPSPAATQGRSSATASSTLCRERLGVDELGEAAVDDQVLVGVADPEPVAGTSPSTVRTMLTAPPSRGEDGPGARQGRPEPAEREGAGVGATRAASAAAVPAAWPMAMHWAMERTAAWASWVAEKQRPATSTLLASRASRARNGMPTTSPSGRYRQVVPVPSWWSSMGAPAEADLVVELAGREHVVGGEPDVAVDPARLPDPDLAAEGDQPRPLVARHLVDQEAGVLEGLAAPGHLGLGEQPRVGRVDHPAALAAGRGRVMIVAVIPSTGVTWSEPSRRGRS